MSDNNESPEDWATCTCNVCSERLEFDPTNAGETIQCPKCGMDTMLFIPQGHRKPAPLVETPQLAENPPPINLKQLNPIIVTTGNEISGQFIESYIGIVRGVVVRSPDLIQGMFGGLKQIVGGNIETYAEVCDETRREAFSRMVGNAEKINANAIIAFRYDATEFAPGITEVLAYGTAVKLAARK